MIFELQNGPVSYDEDRLFNLIYNPLTFSFSTNKNLANSGLIDPDSNFYRHAHNCDYYTERKFNEKLHIEENPNYLSFLHLNVQSLSKNFGPLSNFLGNIIILYWLQHSENDVEMSGFNFIHNHYHNRTGGGVGLYFSTDLNYKVHNDLNYNDITCAKSLFIEIIKPRGKNVGVVYRPPAQDVKEFVTNTDSLINKISRENKICYIMGDFNLNLLNCHVN